MRARRCPDQSVVRDVDTNLDDGAIIEAIVALGHSPKLTFVAGGVETEEERRQLLELQRTNARGSCLANRYRRPNVRRAICGNVEAKL